MNTPRTPDPREGLELVVPEEEPPRTDAGKRLYRWLEYIAEGGQSPPVDTGRLAIREIEDEAAARATARYDAKASLRRLDALTAPRWRRWLARLAGKGMR